MANWYGKVSRNSGRRRKTPRISRIDGSPRNQPPHVPYAATSADSDSGNPRSSAKSFHHRETDFGLGGVSLQPHSGRARQIRTCQRGERLRALRHWRRRADPQSVRRRPAVHRPFRWRSAPSHCAATSSPRRAVSPSPCRIRKTARERGRAASARNRRAASGSRARRGRRC